jgi:hypothetical protein
VNAEKEDVGLAAEKLRARQQWTGDPCGAKYGAKYTFATREFFDEVERNRYQDYAPWMPSVMGFNDFAGARLAEIGCGMGTDLLQFARGGAPLKSRASISISTGCGQISFSLTPNNCPSPTRVSMSSIPTACCITRRAPRRPSAKSTAF